MQAAFATTTGGLKTGNNFWATKKRQVRKIYRKHQCTDKLLPIERKRGVKNTCSEGITKLVLVGGISLRLIRRKNNMVITCRIH